MSVEKAHMKEIIHNMKKDFLLPAKKCHLMLAAAIFHDQMTAINVSMSPDEMEHSALDIVCYSRKRLSLE